MADWLWQGLLFSAASLLLGALIAHWYYRQGKEEKEPTWCVWTAVMADMQTTNELDLCLEYRGTPVTSISISWLLIWNNGEKAIRSSDLSATNPLSIKTSTGAVIMSAEVVSSSDSGNGASVEVKNESLAHVTFDYLNPQHGFVVSLTHTGRNARPISVTGSIVDSRPLKQEWVSASRVKSLPDTARSDFALRLQKRGELFRKMTAVLALVSIVWIAALWWRGLDTRLIVLSAYALITIPFVGTMVVEVLRDNSLSLPVGIEDIDDEHILPEFWDRSRERITPADALFSLAGLGRLGKASQHR